MHLEIITNPLNLDISGFSGTAVNDDYVGTAFKLMDRMWHTVRSKNLKNKGRNIWVYEPDQSIFTGVELNEMPDQDTGLEYRRITLVNYAYYQHIGPYHLIKQAGQNMRNELQHKGYETILPYIEIYGHWTNDETKLETELLMCLV